MRTSHLIRSKPTASRPSKCSQEPLRLVNACVCTVRIGRNHDLLALSAYSHAFVGRHKDECLLGVEKDGEPRQIVRGRSTASRVDQTKPSNHCVDVWSPVRCADWPKFGAETARTNPRRTVQGNKIACQPPQTARTNPTSSVRTYRNPVSPTPLMRNARTNPSGNRVDAVFLDACLGSKSYGAGFIGESELFIPSAQSAVHRCESGRVYDCVVLKRVARSCVLPGGDGVRRALSSTREFPDLRNPMGGRDT
jgi:hypothetical protein